VILTRRALTETNELLVIVDNDTVQMNIRRMAEKSGYHVEAEQMADGRYLHITQAASCTTAEEIHRVSNIVVLVASDSLGRGDAELGQVLVRGFLHALNEVEPLPATLVFINSGVKLVTQGSAVLDDLRALCDKGVEVLACGTCLNYYALKDRVAVGQVSNMYSIAEGLLRADKVVSV
jgi:selenium metabolism protein YedF